MGRPDLRILSKRVADGDAESVVAELKAAIDREPAHVACHVVLARALEALDHHREALASWRSAFALAPDSPVVRNELRRTAARLAIGDARTVRDSRAAQAGQKSLNDDEPYHDLDELIKELEAARIVPNPQVKPVEADRLIADVGDVASETLAKIYANQRFFDEAARVYEKLAAQQPERKGEFLEKAEEIRKRT